MAYIPYPKGIGVLRHFYKRTTIMNTITIRINNESLTEKIVWLLQHIQEDGMEIIFNDDIQNDIKELELLRATRNETSISFDEYLKNAN